MLLAVILHVLGSSVACTNVLILRFTGKANLSVGKRVCSWSLEVV